MANDITANMWETYRIVNELVRFSDAKAIAILAANGVILSIVFSKTVDNTSFVAGNLLVLLILALGFISGFISIYFCAQCLAPRLHSSDNNKRNAIQCFNIMGLKPYRVYASWTNVGATVAYT